MEERAAGAGRRRNTDRLEIQSGINPDLQPNRVNLFDGIQQVQAMARETHEMTRNGIHGIKKPAGRGGLERGMGPAAQMALGNSTSPNSMACGWFRLSLNTPWRLRNPWSSLSTSRSIAL